MAPKSTEKGSYDNAMLNDLFGLHCSIEVMHTHIK